MGKYLFRIGIIIVMSALSVAQFGCSSSPSSRFYVLSSPSTKGPAVSPPVESRCLSIGIGPIKMAAYLDRTQIVTRNSANELQVAEFDRWAEPLKENFTRVLSQNLSTHLCTKTVVVFPWRGTIPVDYRIEMDVLRFDGTLGGNVSLEAWWMVFSGDGKVMLLARHSNVSEPAGGGDYKSLVSAQGQILEKLTREIAEAVKGLPK